MIRKIMVLIPALLLMSGCAHQIQLNPKMDQFAESSSKSAATVGYYISAADKTKRVETPGGGGDKVSYVPYKDTEAVLYTVLNNKFKDVFPLTTLADGDFIANNDIKLIFIPKLNTNSKSSSMFTWPPTSFSVTLTVNATDATGNTVWSKTVESEGVAEFDEFKADFSLSARRATEAAFLKMAAELEQVNFDELVLAGVSL